MHHERRFEQLCRYVSRPPIVNERLALTEDGKVVYKLKKRFRDGSTHVVLDPMTFLERLCALVPRPRIKLVTYHGVFASAAGFRELVVPRARPEREAKGCEAAKTDCDARPARPPRFQLSTVRKPGKRRLRYSWAELMRRVFLLDVLTCSRCGGRRKLLEFLCDPSVVRKILAHLGLPTEPPAIQRARPPPVQTRLPW
jgi:hypothetical protein